IREIRRNEMYQRARAMFDPKRANEFDATSKHVCLRCPIIHRQPHLQHALKENANAKRDESTMAVIDPAAAIVPAKKLTRREATRPAAAADSLHDPRR